MMIESSKSEDGAPSTVAAATMLLEKKCSRGSPTGGLSQGLNGGSFHSTASSIASRRSHFSRSSSQKFLLRGARMVEVNYGDDDDDTDDSADEFGEEKVDANNTGKRKPLTRVKSDPLFWNKTGGASGDGKRGYANWDNNNKDAVTTTSKPSRTKEELEQLRARTRRQRSDPEYLKRKSAREANNRVAQEEAVKSPGRIRKKSIPSERTLSPPPPSLTAVKNLRRQQSETSLWKKFSTNLKMEVSEPPRSKNVDGAPVTPSTKKKPSVGMPRAPMSAPTKKKPSCVAAPSPHSIRRKLPRPAITTRSMSMNADAMKMALSLDNDEKSPAASISSKGSKKKRDSKKSSSRDMLKRQQSAPNMTLLSQAVMEMAGPHPMPVTPKKQRKASMSDALNVTPKRDRKTSVSSAGLPITPKKERKSSVPDALNATPKRDRKSSVSSVGLPITPKKERKSSVSSAGPPITPKSVGSLSSRKSKQKSFQKSMSMRMVGLAAVAAPPPLPSNLTRQTSDPNMRLGGTKARKSSSVPSSTAPLLDGYSTAVAAKKEKVKLIKTEADSPSSSKKKGHRRKGSVTPPRTPPPPSLAPIRNLRRLQSVPNLTVAAAVVAEHQAAAEEQRAAAKELSKVAKQQAAAADALELKVEDDTDIEYEEIPLARRSTGGLNLKSSSALAAELAQEAAGEADKPVARMSTGTLSLKKGEALNFAPIREIRRQQSDQSLLKALCVSPATSLASKKTSSLVTLNSTSSVAKERSPRPPPSSGLSLSVKQRRRQFMMKRQPSAPMLIAAPPLLAAGTGIKPATRKPARRTKSFNNNSSPGCPEQKQSEKISNHTRPSCMSSITGLSTATVGDSTGSTTGLVQTRREEWDRKFRAMLSSKSLNSKRSVCKSLPLPRHSDPNLSELWMDGVSANEQKDDNGSKGSGGTNKVRRRSSSRKKNDKDEPVPLSIVTDNGTASNHSPEENSAAKCIQRFFRHALITLDWYRDEVAYWDKEKEDVERRRKEELETLERQKEMEKQQILVELYNEYGTEEGGKEGLDWDSYRSWYHGKRKELQAEQKEHDRLQRVIRRMQHQEKQQERTDISVQTYKLDRLNDKVKVLENEQEKLKSILDSLREAKLRVQEDIALEQKKIDDQKFQNTALKSNIAKMAEEAQAQLQTWANILQTCQKVAPESPSREYKTLKENSFVPNNQSGVWGMSEPSKAQLDGNERRRARNLNSDTRMGDQTRAASCLQRFFKYCSTILKEHREEIALLQEERKDVEKRRQEELAHVPRLLELEKQQFRIELHQQVFGDGGKGIEPAGLDLRSYVKLMEGLKKEVALEKELSSELKRSLGEEAREHRKLRKTKRELHERHKGVKATIKVLETENVRSLDTSRGLKEASRILKQEILSPRKETDKEPPPSISAESDVDSAVDEDSDIASDSSSIVSVNKTENEAATRIQKFFLNASAVLKSHKAGIQYWEQEKLDVERRKKAELDRIQQLVKLEKQTQLMELQCEEDLQNGNNDSLLDLDSHHKTVRALRKELKKENKEKEKLLEEMKFLAYKNDQLTKAGPKGDEMLHGIKQRVKLLKSKNDQWVHLVKQCEKARTVANAKITAVQRQIDAERSKKRKCESYMHVFVNLVKARIESDDPKLAKAIQKIQSSVMSVPGKDSRKGGQEKVAKRTSTQRKRPTLKRIDSAPAMTTVKTIDAITEKRRKSSKKGAALWQKVMDGLGSEAVTETTTETKGVTRSKSASTLQQRAVKRSVSSPVVSGKGNATFKSNHGSNNNGESSFYSLVKHMQKIQASKTQEDDDTAADDRTAKSSKRRSKNGKKLARNDSAPQLLTEMVKGKRSSATTTRTRTSNRRESLKRNHSAPLLEVILAR